MSQNANGKSSRREKLLESAQCQAPACGHIGLEYRDSRTVATTTFWEVTCPRCGSQMRLSVITKIGDAVVTQLGRNDKLKVNHLG